MSRRRKNREFDRIEAGAKLLFGLLFLIALGIGGAQGFGRVLSILLVFGVYLLFGGALLIALFFLVRYLWRRHLEENTRELDAFLPAHPVPAQRTATTLRVPVIDLPPKKSYLTTAAVGQSLGEIDWYQFEKFCAALLKSEGFTVERKGGAQPDGGVDLIATQGAESMLVQCKHWRTWTLQEKVIREMLGSMTHFQVTRGAIYTLKGWTEPGACFAAQHNITLVDGAELSQRALEKLSPEQLEALLTSTNHHCPKCESPMIWRTGNFNPFWGCSRYPICRGKLNHSGAR